MSDLLSQNVNASMFFIYIGFSLASFAFLCQYLAFPKSLFADLSNIYVDRPPRIVDGSIIHKNDPLYNKLHCFFREIDFVSFGILSYIPYSILIVLICFGVHLGLIKTGCFPKLLILFFTILYFVVRSKVVSQYKRFTQQYAGLWATRESYSCIDLIFRGIIVVMTITILFVFDSGLWLIFFIVFCLICLFVWYLIPIAKRNPVSTILSVWLDVANKVANKHGINGKQGNNKML